MNSRTILLNQVDLDELVDLIAAEVTERIRPLLAAPPEFVTTDELAEVLRVSAPTVDRLRRDGVLSPVKIRNRTVYPLKESVAAMKKERAADE